MDKKTIYKRIKDWFNSETYQERKIRLFRNAPDLEGIIIEKQFIPEQEPNIFGLGGSSEECLLGVELVDGS